VSSIRENAPTSLPSNPSCGSAGILENDSSEDTGIKDHFSTGHLLKGLKGRAISSGLVTALSQIAQLGLNLVSIMILSRLLAPLDFGLVAMVTTVTGFLRIFNDAGLSTATVQREGITHAQVSNLFWANVALGTLATLILALSAPAVAWFFREPRLVSVTLALCITFLITSSTVQHLALLKRQMHFDLIAFIEVGAMLVGVLVGIGMAWLKCGYWSLVGMQLSTPVVAFFLAWSLSRWRPQRPKRGSSTRPLLGFGANLTASSFLWSLAKGSDSLLIGRFFGSAALGLYSRAGALLIRPLAQAMAPLEAVFVPTLSRLQAEPERYRRALFQIFELVAVTSFLFSGLLLVLASPLTLVVLGPKWEEAAVIFAAFTPVALYTPMTCVAGWLFTSQGRGRDFLVMSVISSSVAVLSFLAGLRFGAFGVALGYSLSSLMVQMPVAFWLAGRSGPVTTRDLWIRLFTHLPVFGVVCVATWIMHGSVEHQAPLLQLTICGAVGLFSGAGFISLYSPSRRVAAGLIKAVREWKIARASA
jgi:polysaccharide transporter, PST family